MRCPLVVVFCCLRSRKYKLKAEAIMEAQAREQARGAQGPGNPEQARGGKGGEGRGRGEGRGEGGGEGELWCCFSCSPLTYVRS